MRKKKFGLIAGIVVFIVVAACLIALLTSAVKRKGASAVKQNVISVTAAPSATSPQAATQVPGTQDPNLPEGVYLVDPPAETAYATSGGTTTASGSSAGITIVDPPSTAQSSTGTTQSANTSSGIYIVDAPADSTVSGSSGTSGSSESGIYIVDPPSGGGSSGGSGSGSSQPTGTAAGSGSISGSNGGLRITADYYAVTTSSTTVNVTVTVRLSHAALSSGSRPLSINLGGQSASLNASAIDHSGGSTTTTLGSRTFTVDLAQGKSTSLNLNASWQFNGTYSGTPVSSVSCSGTAYLSR